MTSDPMAHRSHATDAAARAFYTGVARDLGVQLLTNEPLASHTTLKVGGPAPWVFVPETIGQAAAVYAALAEGPLEVRVLGWGSNVIVVDQGLSAAVILTEKLAPGPLELGDSRVRVAAGEPLPGLVRWCAERGLAGLEFAEGIPAFVGGAIRMNAGANGCAFADVARRVHVTGPSGVAHWRSVTAADFAYRDSFAAREGLFVLEAEFQLTTDDPAAINARIKQLRARRRATQPLKDRSAGCVFTNYPGQPIGALVEKLGLKGLRAGDAEVSLVHGNFIVNRGQASAADVLSLVDRVREALEKATGQPPRLEVEIWRDER